jgi:hypothetical protein
MARQHQPMGAVGHGDEGEPQQRRIVEVEAPGAVLGQEAVERVGRGVRGTAGQVQLGVSRLDFGGDRLHGLVHPLVQEPRAQIGVPSQQPGDRGPQPSAVDRPVEHEHDLHVVDVDGVGVVQRVEEHAGLERRQRQDVFELEPGHFFPHLLVSRSSWA